MALKKSDLKKKERQERAEIMRVKKARQPEEIIKVVTVEVDRRLVSACYGKEIETTLQTAGFHVRICEQTHPCTVTWTCNSESINECLLVIPYKELQQLSNNGHLVSTMFPLANKRLHLGVYLKEKSVCRDQVVEMALTELQILNGVSSEPLRTPEEVAALVKRMSQAIIQIPEHQHKQQQLHQHSWYIPEYNKDKVQVDRQGHGLGRLWEQQVTRFKRVTLDTAAAVCSRYGSPVALMGAYDRCTTQHEAETLLQDINVGVSGPIPQTRKLGPVLSRQISTTFTGLNGNQIIY